MRLMRQVYLCINTSSQDSHQRCSSLERQPTNHFTLILSQTVGCTRMLKFNHHPPPFTFTLLLYYKANQQVVADCCEKKKKHKFSLTETFPSLPPSAHSKNRKCWLGYKSHVEDARSISTDTASLGSGQSWNMHGQLTVINVGHWLFRFLFRNQEYSRTGAQFKYRYTGCELQSAKHE